MIPNADSLHAPPWHRLLLVLVALLVALLSLTSGVLAQDEQPEDTSFVDRARRSTVFLMQTYESAGTQVLSCVGSGTVISDDGLILTNAHLASSLGGPCQGERIVVSLPVRLDEPPVPTYLAEPVVLDEELDIAVLQIMGSLDGSLIDQTTLNLPYVPIGDSSALLPGSAMAVSGYPDLTATSVTYVPGVVTGITAEESGSSMAWLRTDSELGGGMSGGGAYNAEGQLIGIPTSAPGTSGSTAGPMCLNIQDNNRDGLITDSDACVPIGGDVTAIRPVVFASSLIEAAQRGFHLEHQAGPPTAAPLGDPAVSRLLFTTDITDTGQPADVVTTVPSGTTSLFLAFDYANMYTGLPYEIRVTRDGVEMPQFSLGPLSWGGDQSGMWYFGTEGKTWPDGVYEFTIFLNGEVAASASIQVGGAAAAQSFSGLTFGVPGPDGNLQHTGAFFPAGLERIDAHFQFSGMLEGQAWREVWYLNGSSVFDETRLWDAGPSGETMVSAINSQGLPLGSYRLELYIGEQLAATGDITLAGSDGGNYQPRMFADSNVASDISRDGEPAGQVGTSGMTMSLGVNSIYAFFDWDTIPNGLDWTYRWFLDGRLIGSSTQRWDAGGAGENYWVALTSDDPLPEGEYAVEVLVMGQPMFSATASVGSGTQPISGAEAESNEVFIDGRVVDALTGEGIPGALVIVLDVLLESPSFTWDESEIHTQAITDRQGNFSLPRGLPRSNYYTMYVFADGYITIVEDNLTIFSDQESPASMRIEMGRP